MIFTRQYISTSPTSTCKPGPPFHIPGHIIDQNHTLASLIKIKLENLKFQSHLQGKAKV
jgi:hypothetical protein